MSRQRRSSPPRAALDAALPEVAPFVPGHGPLPAEMGDRMRASLRMGMGNFVAQQMMRDAMAAPPAADAATALTADQGGEDRAGEGEQAQVEAARDLAAAPGGAPLPGEIAARLGASLGADLSGVRIHANEGAVEDLDAGAAAYGEHLFFAPGAYDPRSDAGLGLLAHEVVHAVESGGAPPADPKSIGATDAGAEQRADAVQAAVEAGEEAPLAVQPGRAPADVMRRGEAGVHHEDLTMPALGVDNPDVSPQGEDRSNPTLTESEEKALQVYAGNYIADNSQVLVPSMVGVLADEVVKVGDSPEEKMAAAGELAQAIVQAMAVLDIGADAAKLVVPENIETYEAERHMDNPQGTSGGDYLVKNQDGVVAPTATPRSLGPDQATFPGKTEGVGVNTVKGADTVRSQGGSAVPGLQYENPTLYEASPAGLSNHIYNSIEASKSSYTQAAGLAADPNTRAEARMNVGLGDHIVQDYFSHSNFIEIALNRYINDALEARAQQPGAASAADPLLDQLEADGPQVAAGVGGREEDEWVATLYDQRVGGPGEQRSVVTTGTYGGTDTKISLAHAMMPMMPKLHAALTVGAGLAFAQLRTMDEEASWPGLMALMEKQGPEGQAFAILSVALGDVGQTITGIKVEGTGTKEMPLQLSEDGPSLGAVPVPDAAQISLETMPLPEAIASYGVALQRFHAWQESLIPLADDVLIAAILLEATRRFEAAVEAFFDAYADAMDNLVKVILVAIVAMMAGGVSPAEAAQMMGMEVGELMAMACEYAEKGAMISDLDHRMDPDALGADKNLTDLATGGETKDPAAREEARAELERRVGPVVGSGTEEDPWRIAAPTPPSHSQISKDHPAHATTDPEGPYAGPAVPASAFFELHVELAREAGRHIYKEVDAVFAEATQGEEAHLIDAAASERRDSEMVDDHDEMLASGEARGAEEAARAKEQGFAHAQSTDASAAEQYEKTPSLKNVHNLVDLFIANPEDDTWWVALVDAFVGAHTDEVYQDILRRNADAA